MKLLLGSRNQGKLREMVTLLGDAPVELYSLNDFPEVGTSPEDAATYAGNAAQKAIFYARATGLNALGDDSGLEVAHLDGRPGVYSARYAGEHASDADRRSLLLSELVSASDRRARFVCSVAVATPDGEILGLFEGICAGELTTVERGAGGFGYDPIFVPDGYSETFGELNQEIKNEISHRARAFKQVREFLEA